MARRPEGAWWRASVGAWYAKIEGRQIRLADGRKNKKLADREFHRLMAERARSPKGLAGLDLKAAHALRDLFLDHVSNELSSNTYDWYNLKTRQFRDFAGIHTAAETVQPHQVTLWIQSKSWSQATRHNSITAVKRMFAWAKQEGLLAENPLVDMKRPGMTAYQGTVSESQAHAIIAAIPDRQFRDFLIALHGTGARLSEIMRLEASMIQNDGVTVKMPGKTTRTTGKPRFIALTPQVAALCQELARAHPEGPIFRNLGGKPWDRNAVRCRFRRLRKKHAKTPGLSSATAKIFRHSFVTDGLERDVQIATMAELAGHADTRMISKVYSKLHERRDHLNRAALLVRPGEPSLPSGSRAEAEDRPVEPPS